LVARAALKSGDACAKLRSGHIVLIGSRAANGTRGQSAYAAAKAGLVGLAQSLAKEYGGRNIRCNVVLPGFPRETRMTAGLGRFNRPECAARLRSWPGSTTFPRRSSRSIHRAGRRITKFKFFQITVFYGRNFIGSRR
jgi:NAD(P)-dependent dehydrogenase (short-subunit alcohol dehydrogenase family)